MFGGTNNTDIGGLVNVKMLVKILAMHTSIQAKFALMKKNSTKLLLVTFLIQVNCNVHYKVVQKNAIKKACKNVKRYSNEIGLLLRKKMDI